MQTDTDGHKSDYENRPKNLLIVCHAPSPNTQALCDTLVSAARSTPTEHINVTLKTPLQTQPEDLIKADALILGTTENLGYMSGLTKDMFDRCYYPVLEVKQGLPVAAYVRAGHDGTGTVRALESITTGLKWRWVQAPLILQGDFNNEFFDQLSELGEAMAAALDQGII